MNISVFGLGYVGAVTAGCLTRQGHNVVGVDVQIEKVDSFNRGVPPIVEPGLDALLMSAKELGQLRGTTNCNDAIEATELSLVCVGTPSNATGALDLSFVSQVLAEIAASVRAKRRPHALVLRSTMLPGSTDQFVEQLLHDLVVTGGLSVFYYPEFLRESTAVQDFEHPSIAIVGTRDGARPPEELMAALFGEHATVVNWPTAEMVKYACNAFHAAKITFANEIGRISKQVQVDSRLVMDVVCGDTKLNLSPYYLKPGNPFGGSCLPKDVRALTNHARVHGLSLPMLESLLPSNDRHLQNLLELVERSGEREVIILGISFKQHTDDLRESAMVEMAQVLLGRGFQIRIYDPALNLANLVGANRRVIDTKMPHLASLLRADLSDALGPRGLVIAAQSCVPIAELERLVTPEHRIVDVNGWPELQSLSAPYEGFCW